MFRKPRLIVLSGVVAAMVALTPVGAAHASARATVSALGKAAKTPVVTWQFAGLVRGPYANYYVEVLRAGKRNGNWINLGKGNGSKNQKWYSIDTGITYGQTAYAFKNLNSGLCMEVRSGGDHARVVQWACDRYPNNARWWEYPFPGKAYTLENVYSSRVTAAGGLMCADLSNGLVYAEENAENIGCIWH